MKMNYIPHPIDTNDTQIPEELNALVEQMAKNVHEVWQRAASNKGGDMARSAAMP